MESKVVTLKNGRRITRYRAFCGSCGRERGYKDKNKVDALCIKCSNSRINGSRAGTVRSRDKYDNVDNIDTSDFIKVGNVTKYRVSCVRCSTDRGYMRPGQSEKLCRSCSLITKTREDCIEIGVRLDFTFLDEEYVSCMHKHNWYCNNCSFEFKRSITDMRKRDNCPYCNRFSSENECRRIFEEKLGMPFPTVRPHFLKNPDTGYKLELDGYCEELGIAFEYDGEFHYEEMDWISDRNRLEKVNHRDSIKSDLCRQNDIMLIRVPYWEKDNLEDYIESKLMINGVIDAGSEE